MNLRVSDRSKLIVQSEIRNMTIECNRIKGINLAQGVCDLDVPELVITGAADGMREGYNLYTRYDGLPMIREALAKKIYSYNGIVADPEKNITVSAGATGAFYCTCMALLNPGDEVIVIEPYYGYHVNTLLAVGVVPVFARLDPPDWQFNTERLEPLVTDRTRAIIVNTPGNPSGKVFTREEIGQLADFAVEKDLFIFTDEIYEYFVFDGRKHISPGSIPKIADRTITISGYSKTFSITGWRIGYSVAQEEWARMIGYVNDLVYVCAPSPLQVGVAKGVASLPLSYYEGVCRSYEEKRELICNTLHDAGIEPHVPQGAYYVLADVSDVPGKDSKEKAMEILRRTGIASVPGNAFYHDEAGENLVRFCFAKRDDVLEKACGNLCKMRSVRK
jgi:aminotransferase